MKRSGSIHFWLFFYLLALAFAFVPMSAKAQGTYNAYAGAETKDQSVQADAFFPNELWVKVGESITWTFVPKNEVHTVTFLTAGQPRPLATPPVGPPFAFQTPPSTCTTSVSASTYDGTACVSSNPVSGGTTYTVTFPKAGNYKLVCLVHTDMNGTVHVVDDVSLLHSRRFYDDQAEDEARSILSDEDRQGDGRRERDSHRNRNNAVIAGTGEIVATGGGLQYRAVVRFLNETIRIHKGESVEWTNLDPTEPHTVTFGTEPANFIPTSEVKLDAPAADGTLTGTIDATSDFLNSGFIQAQLPDRTESAQLPPGTTRIRITFPNRGTYQYHCALHDVDGMVGTVIVE
jgi:plastocyanin